MKKVLALVGFLALAGYGAPAQQHPDPFNRPRSAQSFNDPFSRGDAIRSTFRSSLNTSANVLSRTVFRTSISPAAAAARSRMKPLYPNQVPSSLPYDPSRSLPSRSYMNSLSSSSYLPKSMATLPGLMSTSMK
ncbi:hypothetical protein [Larkinella soli]|uniref:hypothetical protein n=1 Tax=Larkinella soli TaxID=1770527 RepID=UPI000FFB8AA0|nr:hypothetical protein [Larkinella soli]